MKSTINRISKIFQRSKVIFYDDNSKFILMSDCHRGIGGLEDNFFKNQNLFYTALNHYYKEGYTYIELGDGDELWENSDITKIIDEYKNIYSLFRKLYRQKRLYFVYGNHDMVKKKRKYLRKNLYTYYDERQEKNITLFKHLKVYEGIVLSGRDEYIDNKLLLIHGHQGDIINDYMWRFGRFLVRHIWKPLENIGAKDPTKVVTSNSVGKCACNDMRRWSDLENQIIITGHTHKPSFPSKGECKYFNTGSCVHPRCITGIEIEGGSISLIKWSVKVKTDGTLYIGKDILAGPTLIKDFF